MIWVEWVDPTPLLEVVWTEACVLDVLAVECKEDIPCVLDVVRVDWVEVNPLPIFVWPEGCMLNVF